MALTVGRNRVQSLPVSQPKPQPPPLRVTTPQVQSSALRAFSGASGFDATPKRSTLYAAGVQNAHPLQGPTGPGSNPVVDEARRWLGLDTPELARRAGAARSGGGEPFFEAYDYSTPLDASCANFVSSVLIAEGQLPAKTHFGSAGFYASTDKLVPVLKEQGFSEQTGVTSGNLMDPAWCQANLKPGDVVVVNNAKFGHAMIYTGINPETNRPMFIGANGVGEDPSGNMVGPFSPQKVTEVGWSTVQQWMGDGTPKNGDGLTISVYSPPPK
jgi:hypothetical protein